MMLDDGKKSSDGSNRNFKAASEREKPDTSKTYDDIFEDSRLNNFEEEEEFDAGF